MELKMNLAAIKKAAKVKYLAALTVALCMLAAAAVSYFLYSYLYLDVYLPANELENTLSSSQLINVQQIKDKQLEKELSSLEFKQKSCWNMK